MWESITSTVSKYWNYYVGAVYSEWQHLTPMKYGMLLVFIFLAGWVLKKSNLRKP